MSYLIYISYTPYTVYVIHNLCICLPVNGFIFEDNLKISRQSSIRQCVVRTLPFMNCPTIANGQTCLFYYPFASVSSSSSQYLLASQCSVRMLVTDQALVRLMLPSIARQLLPHLYNAPNAYNVHLRAKT